MCAEFIVWRRKCKDPRSALSYISEGNIFWSKTVGAWRPRSNGFLITDVKGLNDSMRPAETVNTIVSFAVHL